MNHALGFGARLLAQAVPAGGVVFASWTTGAAIALYWVESVLLLCACLVLIVRCPAPPRGAEPLPKWKDVLLVHGGAYGIFGAFGAAMLLILSQRPGLAFDVADFRTGLPLMAVCVALGLALDLVELPRRGAELALARVNEGNSRFVLFWLVGFFGTLAAAFTGRGGLFFGVFAGVKTWFELGRFLGWEGVLRR